MTIRKATTRAMISPPPTQEEAARHPLLELPEFGSKMGKRRGGRVCICSMWPEDGSRWASLGVDGLHRARSTADGPRSRAG
jgi:hypothetical protein